MVLLTPIVGGVKAQWQCASDIQTEQILVDGLEVGKDFLDLINDIMNIILSELLNLVVMYRIWEVFNSTKRKVKKQNQNKCSDTYKGYKPKR